MRIVVILFLVMIVASLGSALLFLLRDRGNGGTRVARALAIRVGLSLTLFAMLMAGFATGLIDGKL
ncbi:MAG: twin transmembrane helix small protein [Betaproteobacteria bacterium]|nr:MAG: twin transmembrane helix small protein [Betaproteobacteria bacterium]